MSRPESHVSDDVFLHIPSTAPKTLIFFITGNPGLISYYHEYLTILATSAALSDCAIAGFSLGGFEVHAPHSPAEEDVRTDRGDGDENTWLRGLQWPDGTWKGAGAMYGLMEQIELCYARINALLGQLREGETQGKEDAGDHKSVMNVIIIGHSVGTYIGLEVIRLWGERLKKTQSPLWRPVAAILLMPTIIDLHKSPSGQLATPLLSTVPFLPEVLQLASKPLSYLPMSWLRAIVSKITGMQTGSDGLETTVKFLLSAQGVNEALHLARDELATIRADKWGTEIWGVQGACGDADKKCPPPQGQNNRQMDGAPALYFLFAKDDHWVADATRSQIQTRTGEGPRLPIDQEQHLVHAWCLKQSLPVAQRTISWLQEVLGRDVENT